MQPFPGLCCVGGLCYDDPMIGTEVAARAALHDYMHGYFEFLLSDMGSTRSVHLINGVVYKIERSAYSYENEHEYRKYMRIKDNLPTGVFMPDMFLWDIDGTAVLACEYLDGDITGECIGSIIGTGCDCDNPCLSDETIEALKSYGFTDPSYGNAMWYDGALYLIDIA